MLVETLGHEDADAVELDRLARQLRRRLLENDFEVQLPRAGNAPPDTRAPDSTTIGALIVTVAASRSAFVSTLKVIQAYLETSKARSVKIQVDGDSLEMTGLTVDDQRELIDNFVDRHAKDP
jgi:hypothetical protein